LTASIRILLGVRISHLLSGGRALHHSARYDHRAGVATAMLSTRNDDAGDADSLAWTAEHAPGRRFPGAGGDHVEDSVDGARWWAHFDELMGRVAGRFARVESRR
jgi:hypothetical protein